MLGSRMKLDNTAKQINRESPLDAYMASLRHKI